MRKMIGRPARALLPVALGACALLGHGERAAALALAIIIARLCSLGAGSAFYAASGTIVSESRLRGNFMLALIMGLLGAAGAYFLCMHLKFPKMDFYGIDPFLALAGSAIMLSELFSERLYALTDKLSGPLCDAITAALLLVGMVASRGDNRILFYFMLAALGACGIACFGICGFRRIQVGAAVLREMPRALIRSWLTPALLAGCMMLFPSFAVAPCAAGWAVFAWADAPAKRGEGESGAVDLLTMVPLALLICAAAIYPTEARELFIMALIPIYISCALTALFSSAHGARAQYALLFNTLAYALLACRAGNRLPQIVLWLVYPLAALAIGLLIPDVREGARRSRLRRRLRR